MHQYLERVSRAIKSIDESNLQDIINEIQFAIAKERTIFVAGNGGSAAISSHFVTDLLKIGHKIKKNIRAFSLCDNQSLVTATSNDFGYSNVYSWQLSRLAHENDILITISSSGDSENIIKLLETAKSLHVNSISISGFQGGVASKIANLSIITKSANGDYGPVEDSHSILCHYIADQISKI